MSQSKGINRVLVVDDDLDLLSQAKEAITANLNIPEVQLCSDAKSAMNLLDAEGGYDLAFIDLRMPKISGSALLQHIQCHEMRSVKEMVVVVMCGVVSKEEILLLKELGYSSTFKKPFTDDFFIEKIKSISENKDSGASEFVWKRNFDQMLADSKYQLAEQTLIPKLKKDPGSLTYLTCYGQLCFLQKRYARAEEFVAKILKRDPTFLPALNLASRIQMKQGRFEEALRLLDKAQNLSPQNIERFIVMGEVNLGRGEAKVAETNFRDALKINSEDRRAKFGLGRSLATQGRIEESRKIVEGLGNTNEFAAYFNNKGILLVKSGRILEGIKLYENAIEVLMDEESEFRLMYNISLAYFRMGRFNDALEKIEHCLDLAPGAFRKGENLKKRIQNAQSALKKMGSIKPKSEAPAIKPLPKPEPAPKSGLDAELEKYGGEDIDAPVTLTGEQTEFIMGGFENAEDNNVEEDALAGTDMDDEKAEEEDAFIMGGFENAS